VDVVARRREFLVAREPFGQPGRHVGVEETTSVAAQGVLGRHHVEALAPPPGVVILHQLDHPAGDRLG
jgi:hypothetical protein